MLSVFCVITLRSVIHIKLGKHLLSLFCHFQICTTCYRSFGWLRAKPGASCGADFVAPVRDHAHFEDIRLSPSTSGSKCCGPAARLRPTKILAHRRDYRRFCISLLGYFESAWVIISTMSRTSTVKYSNPETVVFHGKLTPAEKDKAVLSLFTQNRVCLACKIWANFERVFCNIPQLPSFTAPPRATHHHSPPQHCCKHHTFVACCAFGARTQNKWRMLKNVGY